MSAQFQLLGAHPALDFVNTLDNRFAEAGPTEMLPAYADLLAFMEQSQMLESRQLGRLRKESATPRARKALRAAHGLREALAAFFYDASDNGVKPGADCLKSLESYFTDAHSHQELMWKQIGDAQPPRPTWDWGRFETDAMLPVWAMAKSAAALLTSPAIAHVHACGSPTCRWLFLDTSKNHTRRWCDMKLCGNRMKARRFQATH